MLDDSVEPAAQPTGGEGRGKEEMEIAWRYRKMPQVEVCLYARRGVCRSVRRGVCQSVKRGVCRAVPVCGMEVRTSVYVHIVHTEHV